MEKFRKIRSPFYRAGWLALLLLALALPARALTINPTYDFSVTNLTNAAQVEAAFAVAAQTFQNLYTNAITVNIIVYWGDPGFFGGIDLGASRTSLKGLANPAFSFAQLTNALRAARVSAADSNSVASLPASNPTITNAWWIPRAEAKALGLTILGIGLNDTNRDGDIGFSTNVLYTFDATNRAVAGRYDFIAVAQHEIAEVLGCGSFLGGAGGTNGFEPYDLFRYTNNGAHSFGPNDTNVYFSIDRGTNVLKVFNLPSNGGDVQDWATSSPADARDAFITSGQSPIYSANDVLALDILGYNGPPIAPRLTGVKLATNVFQVSFTNVPNLSFSLLTATNLTLPVTNWTTLGVVTQISSGQYQFADKPVTNKARFYRVREN